MASLPCRTARPMASHQALWVDYRRWAPLIRMCARLARRRVAPNQLTHSLSADDTGEASARHYQNLSMAGRGCRQAVEGIVIITSSLRTTVGPPFLPCGAALPELRPRSGDLSGELFVGLGPVSDQPTMANFGTLRSVRFGARKQETGHSGRIYVIATSDNLADLRGRDRARRKLPFVHNRWTGR